METSSVQVAIFGALGRMGKRVCCLASEDDRIEVVGGIVSKNDPNIGKKMCECISELSVKRKSLHKAILVDNIESLNPQPQVVIDFSNPEASVQLAQTCAKLKIAWVCGTTGFSEKDKSEIHKVMAVETVPWMIASNFSLGICLLRTALKHIAMGAGDYFDVEMTETHHTRKKDKPSGTALTLRESVYDGIRERHRQQICAGDKKEKTIDIHSLRLADVVGDHTIFFASKYERITIEHTAQSRDVFANGAIEAAKWIVGRAPKEYDIRNVTEKV